MQKPLTVLYLVWISLILLSGCVAKEEQWARQLEESRQSAASELQRLRQHMEAGHLRNASLLELYARHIKEKRPEMAEIADALALDATTRGPLYQGLAARMENAGGQIKTAAAQGEAAVAELAQEIQSIRVAAAPDVFNAALSDPVNVLADMSGGALGRVEAIAAEAADQVREAKDYGAGSALIGNPNYGQWKQNSDGTSFWEFYGMYALFSNLMQPVFYDDWARHRRYSYYNDYGWNHYQSPRQRQSANTTFERAKQKFARQGKTFQSPYATYSPYNRSKAGADGSSRFGQVTKTPAKFGSGSGFQNSKYASGPAKSGSGAFSSPYNSRGGSSSRSFGGGGK